MKSANKENNIKDEFDEINPGLKKSIVSRLALIYFALLFFSLFLIFSLIYNQNFERQFLTPQNKNRFFETVDRAIFANDSLMLDIESIKMIFNSIDRELNGSLFKYGFINILEDYLVRNSLDSTKVKLKNNHRIFELIKRELEQEPYSRLTSEQRRLLINLDRSIIEKDSVLARFNLVELNDLLRNQNEYIIKLEKQNSWSFILGITGVLLTLIFGLFAVFKPNSILLQIVDKFMDKTKRK